MAVNWSPMSPVIRLYSMCRYSTRKHRVGHTLRHNIYKRSQCLTSPRPLEVNSGLSMYAYMRNVLKCKYSFCCVDNCKRIIEKPGGNAVIEYFVCKHYQKVQKAVKSIDPKAKESFTMFAHQFNIYRKIKIIASPRLDSFCNMQENKQIIKSRI